MVAAAAAIAATDAVGRSTRGEVVQPMAGRIGSGILTLRGGVLLAIRPRRQTINHASETTTSRTTRPPETKDQLLRVAATARRPHPEARTPRPSWTPPSSVGARSKVN